MTRPRKNPGVSGIRTWDLPLSRRDALPLGQRGGNKLWGTAEDLRRPTQFLATCGLREGLSTTDRPQKKKSTPTVAGTGGSPQCHGAAMPRGRFSNSPVTQLLETSYSLKNSKLETSYSLKNSKLETSYSLKNSKLETSYSLKNKRGL